jgi:hypothetical protein
MRVYASKEYLINYIAIGPDASVLLQSVRHLRIHLVLYFCTLLNGLRGRFPKFFIHLSFPYACSVQNSSISQDLF